VGKEMFWILFTIRLAIYLFSWIFIILQAILKDSKETREEAQIIKNVYGEKRTNLLNTYIFFILPELIVVCLVYQDIKTIFKGDIK
jgi:hypothetical protein